MDSGISAARYSNPGKLDGPSAAQGFLIFAEDEYGDSIPANELAHILFAFDESSFFGTNMKVVERGEDDECIFLTPLEAIHYFANPGYNELASIDWPADWFALQKAARMIRLGLETAAFKLAVESGPASGATSGVDIGADRGSASNSEDRRSQSVQPVWRLDVANLPEPSNPAIGQAIPIGLSGSFDSDSPDLPDSASPASLAAELPYYDAWFNQVVWQMITVSPEVGRAFMAVQESHPALAGVIEPKLAAATGTPTAFMNFMDADEWAVAIGLKQDDMPFTFAIQLLDPYSTAAEITDEENAGHDEAESGNVYGDKADAEDDADAEDNAEAGEEDWQLRVVLEDKSDPTRQIYLPEGFELPRIGDAEEILSEGVPLGDALSPELYPESPVGPIPDSWLPYFNRVDRKLQYCVQIAPWLANEQNFARNGQPTLKAHLNSDEALLFLEEASIRIAEAGIQVYVPSWWEEIQRAAVKMKASVKSPGHTSTGTGSGTGRKPLFGLTQTVDFDWRIAIGDVEMSDAEFLRLVAQNRKLVRFRGRFIRVDSEEFRAIAARIKKTKTGKGLTLRDVFELHLLGGTMTDLGPRKNTRNGNRTGSELDSEHDSIDEPDSMRVMIEVELDNTLARLMTRLTHTKEIPNVEVPDTFRGTLRPYQQIGVSWLTFLRTYGIGACLADDMGLGKTIQYIAYLLAARNEVNGQQHVQGGLAPSLLICPTSVIGNWQKEIARFAPSLDVYVHYGSGRKHSTEFLSRTEAADVVLTSYTLAQMDEEDFTQVTFDSICLDEAQNIKNPHTKQAQSIRKFEAGHRIAMTGTPIENRLTELWSIFDFLNPGYLGSMHGFQEKFVTPIERHQDAVKLEQVKQLVHPLLLRRVKQDPAIQLDLPEKVESKVFVSLTPEQAALYENVVTDMLSKLDKLTGIERSGIILTTLLKLKQICNHPINFLKVGDVSAGITSGKNKNASGHSDGEGEERSNKLTRLIEMVSELREEGDSCLIFTQFVEMGKLLVEALSKVLGEKALFLHGGLSKTKRDSVINGFQNGEAGIFILSLKAGGVGLNLTAANHVFHFDRWWNPAVENQATDRAFRIGQTKQVEVHKFVTLGTLEERIDEMIEQKQALSNEIVGGGESWITQMSTNELRDLFVLRREWVDMDA
jgi:hypothetical protein